VIFDTKAKVEGKSGSCRKVFKVPHTGSGVASLAESGDGALGDDVSSASSGGGGSASFAAAGSGVRAPSPFSPGHHARVATVKGYMLLGTPRDGVLLFNTTGVRDTGAIFLAKMAPAGTAPEGDDAAAATMAVVAPMAVTFSAGLSTSRVPEILVAIADGSRLAVLEALLPYEPPKHDINWMRMPMMVGGVVVVFGWQFLKGKGGGGLFGGGRRGRGNGGRGDPDDIASMMGTMGGGGVGMGGLGRGLGRGFDAGGAAGKFGRRY